MKNELISVIVPIYNTSKYLSKCIDSIINQTYKNLEIILVNDGSTDNSLDICNKYKLIDSRIIIINKDNGGLSSAKNIGLDNHKGRYIAFIDSDDYVDNNFIGELYNNLISTNSDISLCNYYDTINNIDYPNYDNSFILGNNGKYKCLFGKYSVQTCCSWNKLYKDYIFNNIRFPEGLCYEDSYVICDILFKTNKISYMLDKCLYHYNKRTGSITTNYNMKSFDNILAYKNIYRFLLEHNIDIDYSMIKVLICIRIRDILLNIKEKNIDIDKYKKDFNIYAKDILRDKQCSLKSKIKIIMVIVVPRFYFKLRSLKYKISIKINSNKYKIK